MEGLKNRRMREKRKKVFAIVSICVLVLGVAILATVALQSASDKDTENLITVETEMITDTEFIEGETTQEETDGKDFTMFFTGDVMLQYCTGIYANEGINGIISEYLEQEMVNADMTVINNEFPFSNGGTPAPDKQFTFRVDPIYTSVLQDMGVDVASLANNHALDYGQDALLDTFVALNNEGIPYVGAGQTKEEAEKAVFVESGGRTVGVLSASRVIPVESWNIENSQPGLFCTYDSTRMVQRIKEIEKECDYVVVFVHWGIEREAYPEEYQRNLAKQYIDAGADLVVGNHSHVPQGIEYYKGVPIVYCLGNFIFNGSGVDTYAVKAVWNEQGNTTLQVIPVDAENYHTSELTGDEAQAFYDYLESISFGVTIDENGMVIPAGDCGVPE